jgi:hypothetical protein
MFLWRRVFVHGLNRCDRLGCGVRIFCGNDRRLPVEKVATAMGIGGEPYHIYWRTEGIPLGLGLVAYTFSGRAIVSSIYNSMKRPQDFERMIDLSFPIVLASCSWWPLADITCLNRLLKIKLLCLWRKVPRCHDMPHVANDIDGILLIHPRHVPTRLGHQ